MREHSQDGVSFKTGSPARSLYSYIWRTSRRTQALICLVTLLISPLPTVYLDLQRRIIDDAIPQPNLRLLATLSGAYLGVLLAKSGLKFLLSMMKSVAAETIAMDLRRRIMMKSLETDETGGRAEHTNTATLVAMLSVEVEDLCGFASEAISLPLLNIGMIIYIIGYLLWLEPAIAAFATAIYFPQAIIVPLTQRTINRLARLRIRSARLLADFAIGNSRARGRHTLGLSTIRWIYRIRIWIYLRKYFLSELGNLLASLGPLIVLSAGGYLVITGNTELGVLVVFITGLQRVSDPWHELVSFWRSISNTGVMYLMICDRLDDLAPTRHP